MQSQLMQSLHQFLNFTMHHRVTITTLLMFMFLLLFLFSWLIEPRRLINGLIFTAFGLTFLTWAAILIFSQHNVILTSSFSFIALAFLFGIFFLVTFSWIFFLWNAYFVWKYESHYASSTHHACARNSGTSGNERCQSDFNRTEYSG